MRLPETDDEAAERLWLEYRRKDIRKQKDAGKRLRSFAYIGDLESVLQLLPERVYAFCAGGHPRLGRASPVRPSSAGPNSPTDPISPVCVQRSASVH